MDFTDYVGVCPQAYAIQSHSRNGTASNVTFTRHNIPDSLTLNCTINATTDYSWSNKTCSAGDGGNCYANFLADEEVSNVTLQHGSATCVLSNGTSIPIYSGCTECTYSSQSGSTWIWGLGMEEEWKITNRLNAWDKVDMDPEFVYAGNEIKGIFFKVISRWDGLDHPGIGSAYLDFTLPAQCSMGITEFPVYGLSKFAGHGNPIIYYVDFEEAASSRITCTSAATITLNLTASRHPFMPTAVIDAQSENITLAVTEPQFTIDNVQAFENDGAIDFWGTVSYRFTRQPVPANTSCLLYMDYSNASSESYEGGLRIDSLSSSKIFDSNTFTSYFFDANASDDGIKGANWTIACNSTASLEESDCWTETSNSHNKTFTTCNAAGSGPAGFKITVGANNLNLISVTKNSSVTATTAYLNASDRTLLASAAFSGNVATFNYNLTAGATYYVSASSGGSTYTFCYASAAGGYPFVAQNLTFVTDHGGHTDNVYNLISLLVTEQSCPMVPVPAGNQSNGTFSGTSKNFLRVFRCEKLDDDPDYDRWKFKYSYGNPDVSYPADVGCVVADGSESVLTQLSGAGLGNASAWVKSSIGSGGTKYHYFDWGSSQAYYVSGEPYPDESIAHLAFAKGITFIHSPTFTNNLNVSQEVNIYARNDTDYGVFQSTALLDMQFVSMREASIQGPDLYITNKVGLLNGTVELGDNVTCKIALLRPPTSLATTTMKIYVSDFDAPIAQPAIKQSQECFSSAYPLTRTTYTAIDGPVDLIVWQKEVPEVGIQPECNSTDVQTAFRKGKYLVCMAQVSMVNEEGTTIYASARYASLPLHSDATPIPGEDTLPELGGDLGSFGAGIASGLYSLIFSSTEAFLGFLLLGIIGVAVMPFMVGLLRRKIGA